MSSAAASSSSDYTYPACIREGIAEIEQLDSTHTSQLARIKRVIAIIERHERERRFDSTVLQFCREYGALIHAAIRNGTIEDVNVMLRHVFDNPTFFAWTSFGLGGLVHSIRKLPKVTELLMVLMAIPFHPEPRKSAGLLVAYATLVFKQLKEKGLTDGELSFVGYHFLHFASMGHFNPSINGEPLPPVITADRHAKVDAVFADDSVFQSTFAAPNTGMTKIQEILLDDTLAPATHRLVVNAMVREGAMSRELLRSLAKSSILDPVNGHVFSRAYNMRYPDKRGMVQRGQLDDGYRQMVQHLAEPFHVPELTSLVAEYAHDNDDDDDDEGVNHEFNQLVVSNARSASAMTPAAASSALARARNNGKRPAAGDHDDEPDAARSKMQARLRLGKW